MQRALPIYEKRVKYHDDVYELQIFAYLLMRSGRVSDALEYAGRAASILENDTNMPAKYSVSFHMSLSMSMTF